MAKMDLGRAHTQYVAAVLSSLCYYLLSAFPTAHHHYNSKESLGLQKDSKVDDHMADFVLRLERHFFFVL